MGGVKEAISVVLYGGRKTRGAGQEGSSDHGQTMGRTSKTRAGPDWRLWRARLVVCFRPLNWGVRLDVSWFYQLKLSVRESPARPGVKGLTPSALRRTRHSTYARPTPPMAQRGPLQRVFGVGVDVHDRRQRCNSEIKHPRLGQLFDARSHDPSSCSSRSLSANRAWVCSDPAGQPASASQDQVMAGTKACNIRFLFLRPPRHHRRRHHQCTTARIGGVVARELAQQPATPSAGPRSAMRLRPGCDSRGERACAQRL